MNTLQVTTNASKKDSVSFNLEKYRKLKRTYNKALKEQKESFFFEEHELLTCYAKLMLIYLKPKFESKI